MILCDGNRMTACPGLAKAVLVSTPFLGVLSHNAFFHSTIPVWTTVWALSLITSEEHHIRLVSLLPYLCSPTLSLLGALIGPSEIGFGGKLTYFIQQGTSTGPLLLKAFLQPSLAVQKPRGSQLCAP